MYRFRPFTLAIFALAAVPTVRAGFNPETGSYVFKHYTPKDYGAAPQNFAIAQDHRGIMYFANLDGVLEFDGVSWRIIRLPGDPLARSLAVSEDGTVYVGGHGNFGVLAPNAHGTLQFVSLLPKVLQADRAFADVWRVLAAPDGIYFSAYQRLFRLNSDGSIHVWRPKSNFGKAFLSAGAVCVKTREEGLLRVDGDRLVPVSGGGIFAKLPVESGISLAHSGAAAGLIGASTTLYKMDAAGVTPFPTAADHWFQENVVNTIAMLPSGEIAVGSRKGGMALLSSSGALDRLVTKSDGLADDTIEAILTDSQGGVWLAGNNGVTRFNPGLSWFGAPLGLDGDVDSIDRNGRTLYVGTSTGLFAMTAEPGRSPSFERITEIPSRVAALLPLQRSILAATDDGIFEIAAHAAQKIFATTQAIVQLSLSPDSETVYVAMRAHVYALRRTSGTRWTRESAFDDPSQEFRSVLEDSDGSVWATSANTIWHLHFHGQQVEHARFEAAQGVPSGYIYIRNLGGHVVFATPKGLLRFVPGKNRFEPDPVLGPTYSDGNRDVDNVFDGAGGSMWVTSERDHYHDLLRRTAEGYQRVPSLLIETGIQGIYSMSVDPDGTVWASGAEQKLYRWSQADFGDPDHDFRVLTRRIEVSGDKDPFYGGAGKFDFMRLPYRSDALRFEFAAPFYEDPAAIEYQVFLEGSDHKWSNWSHEAFSDRTNLPEGSYRLRVRARSPHGAMNEESVISFGILPPWYRTWWAYGIWALCAAIAIWGVVKWRTRKLVAEKRHLEAVVEERTVEIRDQERKTHSLLLNILPESVADELKSTGAVKPVGFDEVTVCFTDFVGFTLSSEKMQPGKLVDALNEYFTRFDEIISRYGLEKLKTIGDSYMFVSGLPTRRKSHAVDAVLAALEMAAVVQELRVKPGGTGWNVRIGLNSGPVVAGVVGIRKFAFDIWGDTVNFAARMESSGVHGRVNMSQRTYDFTGGLIECEARGHVKIKEGRELPMFLAVGPAQDFAARYEREFGASAPALNPAPDLNPAADLVAQA